MKIPETIEEMNELIQQFKEKHGSVKGLSDGYHTFQELYHHRIELFITLMTWICYVEEEQMLRKSMLWKSKLHSDGTMFDGMFVAGIEKYKGRQITYHLPLEYWDRMAFVETLAKAPEYDGHTSEDVLIRLREL